MGSDRLDVYVEEAVAGRLLRDHGGHVSFQYDDDYRRDPRTTPLSLSIPKSAALHDGDAPGYWIDNLLPDNQDLRERTAVKFGENRSTPFDLLRHVGLDAAGAVQIVPADTVPSDAGDFARRSDHDIAEEIRRLHRDDASVDMSTESGRWSLAGQQGKFALSRIGGEWFEPTGRAGSTHIFKVGVNGLRNSDVAEYITMRAAARLGLDVAEVSMRTFEGELAVIARRYDRVVRGDGTVVRIHQEDACQALSVPMARKYENEGGPGASDIAGIIRGAAGSRTSADLQALARWHAFNLLSGATDGHGKNVSFLLRGGAVRLAPTYDIIAFPLVGDPEFVTFKAKMAMKFGGEYRFRNIGEKEVIAQAHEFGVDSDWYVAQVADMAERLPDAYRAAINDAAEVIGRTRGLASIEANFERWNSLYSRTFAVNSGDAAAIVSRSV